MRTRKNIYGEMIERQLNTYEREWKGCRNREERASNDESKIKIKRMKGMSGREDTINISRVHPWLPLSHQSTSCNTCTHFISIG